MVPGIPRSTAELSKEAQVSDRPDKYSSNQWLRSVGTLLKQAKRIGFEWFLIGARGGREGGMDGGREGE